MQLENDLLSVTEKVLRGYYKSKVPCPERPKKPVSLFSSVDKLTNEQIAAIPQLRLEYDEACKTYKAQQKACREDQYRMDELFRKELFEENGFESSDHFAQLMFSKAYKHTTEMSQVVYWFEDFMDFHTAAEKMVKDALLEMGHKE